MTTPQTNGKAKDKLAVERSNMWEGFWSWFKNPFSKTTHEISPNELLNINKQPNMFIMVERRVEHSEAYSWLPLFYYRNQLTHLKLSNVRQFTHREDRSITEPPSFVHFIPVIESNMATPRSVELTMFRFPENVDFKVFQQLSQLQTLKLLKYDDRLKSIIVNLNCLPESLTKLSISGLACENDQLDELAKGDHLENLWYIQLNNVILPAPISARTVLALLEKKSLLTIDLDTVTLSGVLDENKAKVKGNWKYWSVCNEYWVQLRQNVDPFDGIVLGFTIECKDVTKVTSKEKKVLRKQKSDTEIILAEFLESFKT